MASLLDMFGESGVLSRLISSGKEPELYPVPTVHRNDVEPVCIIQPNLKNGPWIAGGACLRWFQGIPVGNSDIDVFCKNAVQAQQVIERVKSYGRFHVKFQSENAVTLSYNQKDDLGSSWTIQVITRRYFADIREVINSFDITVCEVATAGNEWELGPFTARDIREKNLRFKLPMQPDAPKRLLKYWIYGYRPVDGTLEAIRENTETQWVYSGEDTYNNAF